MTISLLLFAAAAARAEAADTSSQEVARLKVRAEELLARLDGAGSPEIWIVASKLGALGGEVAPILASKLEMVGDVKKLAIGRALCAAGEPNLGGRVLLELARSGKASEVRIYAARSVGLTPELWGLDPVIEALVALVEHEPEAAVRVALADALLRVVKGGHKRTFLFGDGRLAQEACAKALEVLERILEGDERAASREAALVLGENGFEDRSHTRLVELATEPTPDGKRALLVLSGGGRPEWVDLLDEISREIRKSYVDEERVDREALFDAAAKGMVESLDDFSTYLTGGDVKDMNEMITGSYEGIGAWVGMRDGAFTVISPVYGGPAYRSGIRSLDRIVEVDGKPTGDIGFQKTIKKLKGPKGTPVVVRVLRRGWSAPQGFTIIRERITIKISYHTMLPGGIGYLRLARFGDSSGSEARQSVGALLEGGAASFVLDLRDNGGGLLSAAVEVADVFLGPDRVIVYSEGRREAAPKRRFFSSTDDALGGKPLVVLVNSGTASASEIVSGSLQDWGRARILGERTFGKGSVQSLKPLRSRSWSTKLKLTIARYYLPSGRCIDKKGRGDSYGVKPDVEVTEAALPAWESEAIVRVGLRDEVEKYVRKSFPLHAELFAGLAVADGGSLEAYPGLRSFLGEVPEHVSDRSIRMLARASVRRRVADERGERFICDLQEDRVLRRGVYELLIRREDEVELPPALQAIVDEFEHELGEKQAAADPATN